MLKGAWMAKGFSKDSLLTARVIAPELHLVLEGDWF